MNNEHDRAKGRIYKSEIQNAAENFSISFGGIYIDYGSFSVSIMLMYNQN